jgi:predicted metal-binding membrane protein
MTESAQSRRRVINFILLLSAVSWVVLFVRHYNSGNAVGISYCSADGVAESLVSLTMRSGTFSISSLAQGWLIMLVAMMLPTLIAPILHVYERSFKRRRLRSISLFLLGYSLVWTITGALMLFIQIMLGPLLLGSYGSAVAVGVLAFVWQCSPLKQLCLNRNHNHRELAAFGRAADSSAVQFGMILVRWLLLGTYALPHVAD